MQFGNTKIGGMSFGSTRIGGAKYGNTLVFQPGGQPQPTIIPYIRGGADGSYIDTGITADGTTKVIVWARNWNPTSGFLFGSRQSAGVNGFSLGTHSGAQLGQIRVDYAQTNNTLSRDAFVKLCGYHKYELYQGDCKVDGQIVATASYAAFSNQFNIHIIGNNNGGTHTDASLPIDICACKIYKNDVLVRDFTAVNSPSVGLYDAVSQTLFTNAGSGSLTYGEFDNNAYTPLEYIECSKQQYFDTGLYGNNAISVVSKFRLTSSTPAYTRLFGVRSSSSGPMEELMVGNTTTANKYFYVRYGSNANTIYNTLSKTNKDLVYIQSGNALGLYEGTTALASVTATASTFTTTETILVGAGRSGSSPELQYSFYGRIYYMLINLHSYVPAKVNDIAGMYDTYNDVFYPSETDTPFVAGTTI